MENSPDNFGAFLNKLNHSFKVIGITESCIKSVGIDFPILNYKAFHTPTEADAGGTSLYILKDLKPSRRKDLESQLYVPKTLESTFGEITSGSNCFIIGTVYKHPFMKINDFLSFLGPVIDKINCEGKSLILLGDFNIDLLKFNADPSVFKFLDTLGSYSLKPYINKPTRITENSKSLIDNIFISSIPCSASSGNFLTGLSDHLIQFTVLKNSFFKPDASIKYYKDWKKFDSFNFCNKFNNFEWIEAMQLDKKNPELSFSIFYEKLIV